MGHLAKEGSEEIIIKVIFYELIIIIELCVSKGIQQNFVLQNVIMNETDRQTDTKTAK